MRYLLAPRLCLSLNADARAMPRLTHGFFHSVRRKRKVWSVRHFSLSSIFSSPPTFLILPPLHNQCQPTLTQGASRSHNFSPTPGHKHLPQIQQNFHNLSLQISSACVAQQGSLTSVLLQTFRIRKRKEKKPFPVVGEDFSHTVLFLESWTKVPQKQLWLASGCCCVNLQGNNHVFPIRRCLSVSTDDPAKFECCLLHLQIVRVCRIVRTLLCILEMANFLEPSCRRCSGLQVKA